MSRNVRLKAAYETWKSDTNDLTRTNDLFEELIPFVRSVVRSVILQKDMHDEAESSAMIHIFKGITPEIESITGWARTVTKNACINVLRTVKVKKVEFLDSDSMLESLRSKSELDLSGLTNEQKLVSQLLGQGNSQRSIMADTGLSRRRLKSAMKAISKHLRPEEIRSNLRERNLYTPERHRASHYHPEESICAGRNIPSRYVH